MKINWKYAFTEIFIVIIGISIAFSLNTWKENYNNRKQKKQYLENLVSDIEQEIDHLEENQKNINNRLQQIGQLKPFLGIKQQGRDTIARKLFQIANLITFSPENTTYQTLINSGDMKLINNFQLKRNIEKHYALHDTVLKDYKRIELIHQKYLADFFIYHIDFNDVSKGNMDFLDNPLIKNILASIEGAYFLILQSNQKCVESNQQLIEIIKDDLG